MKIIFLDIDGPLLPLRATIPFEGHVARAKFDPCAVAMVNRLARDSGALFVVSSNWAQKGKDYVLSAFAANGVNAARLHSDWATPRGENSGSWSRGKEIMQWLANHPDVTNWCAFDDEEIDDTHAVTVSLEDGILYAHYERAAELLGISAV